MSPQEGLGIGWGDGNSWNHGRAFNLVRGAKFQLLTPSTLFYAEDRNNQFRFAPIRILANGAGYTRVARLL